MKNQGSLAACTSFGGIAAIEAVINLYFNQNLNVDLSEMATLSCAEDIYRAFDPSWECANINSPGIFICNAKHIGIPDEACYPFVDHLTQSTFICDNLCNDYQQRVWKVHDFGQLLPDSYYRNFVLDENNNPVYEGPLLERLRQKHITEGALKKTIIEKGPVALDYPTQGHAVVITGWGLDHGGQFWKIKNSWGEAWEERGFGKIYDSNTQNFIIGYIETPIYQPAGKNYQILCEDKDKDGFCNWGISGNKPLSCPLSCGNDKDWDDSNPKVGPLGLDK